MKRPEEVQATPYPGINNPDGMVVWMTNRTEMFRANLAFDIKRRAGKATKRDWEDIAPVKAMITNPDVNVQTQIIPVKSLTHSLYRDPALKITRPGRLAHSDALIFNIQYPLGFSAYHILSEVLANVASVKGVYVMGKAAVLNAEIGDIHIPRLVFDEHTQNSYIFKNCFNTFFPFVANKSSILTQQKAVSVLGTYLENEELLKLYFQNNLTIIEMESGPYLGAITEATYDTRLPKDTIIDLNTAPFDIGIINYASDTPYSQTKNLGSRALSLDGVEATYLASTTILQRIIDLEQQK